MPTTVVSTTICIDLGKHYLLLNRGLEVLALAEVDRNDTLLEVLRLDLIRLTRDL